MQQNFECQGSDDSWIRHGLGLQDRDGAVARARIDLQHPQSQVDQEIQDFLHGDNGLDEIEMPFADQPDLTNVASGCSALYGFCRNHAQFHEADRLARQLAKQTSERKLPAGSLVRLERMGAASSGEAACSCHFLGVLCHRPLNQVLARAWQKLPKRSAEENDKYSLIEDDSAMPVFETSYEVFRDLLGTTARTDISVKVQVLAASFENSLWSVERLEVSVVGVCSEFVLNSFDDDGPKQPKAEVRLPFGLKLPKKPRKVRSATAKPALRRGRGHGGARNRGRGRTHPASRESSSSGTSNKSSSSESPAAPAGSDGAHLDAATLFGSDGAEAVGMLPSAAAVQEEHAVADAAAEYASMLERRKEIASQYRAGGSYFVKVVGFDEGSVAPTSRSQCYHCNSKIEKGCARFSYFWNERRPSRYMHATCVHLFVQQEPESRRDQAVAALTKVVSTTGSEAVKHASQAALTLLANSAGPPG